MIRIALGGLGRRSGPGLWGAGLFDFWAKSVIRMALFGSCRFAPLIAKAI